MHKILSVLRKQGVIYVLLGLVCIFLACLSKNYDYDLYARLIVGEHFLNGLNVAYEDFVSYTPTHLWYDHEWGSGVVFYIFLKYLGNFGLVLLQALTMFFTAFFVIKTQQLQKHAYPFSLTFITVFLLIFSHQNPSIVRCQMFSFMFFAMFIYFLEKTRKTGSDVLWLVPFITVIWNNLHGGIVSGLGIIFIYMIGELISKRPWKKYLYVLIVSTLLLPINPYGIDYLFFLISANTKARIHITEWNNILAQGFIRYHYPVFAATVFGFVIALNSFIKKRHKDITGLMLLTVTVILGTLHLKLLSLPLIVIASLYYNDIMHLIRKNCIRIAEILTYICIIVCIGFIPFLNPAKARVCTNTYPIYETEFIKINNIKGNLLTAFELGSYVSYKLYPDNLIYMDGRYEEVYYDSEFESLLDFELAKPQWEAFVDSYQTQILMPEKTAPIYKSLEESPKWVKIFEGTICGVFVKKENAKKEYLQPSVSLKYYQDNHFDSNGKFGSNNEQS